MNNFESSKSLTLTEITFSLEIVAFCYKGLRDGSSYIWSEFTLDLFWLAKPAPSIYILEPARPSITLEFYRTEF